MFKISQIVNGASRYANAGICSVWVLILKLAKLSCYHCSECCLLVKQWWHSRAVNLPPKSDSLCIPSPLNLLVVQTIQLCSHTPLWIILFNRSPFLGPQWLCRVLCEDKKTPAFIFSWYPGVDQGFQVEISLLKKVGISLLKSSVTLPCALQGQKNSSLHLLLAFWNKCEQAWSETETSNMDWPCKFCKFATPTKDELLKHYRLRHIPGVQPLPCPYLDC